MDATSPEERIYLSVSNEVHAPRQCTLNAAIAPTSSPDFEIQEIQGVFVSVWNQREAVLALHPNTMIGMLIDFSFLNPGGAEGKSRRDRRAQSKAERMHE